MPRVSAVCRLPGPAQPTPKQDPAPGHLLQVLDSRARRLFEEVNFFGEKNADRICAELQALAGRAVLTTREASLLLSLVSHLQKSREKP